ncbi:Hypothetical protein PENO1_083610 [Penicillium occitanis (nom. inval.)]|nr:Hypothetical protein PENO1_083610 [Penicillium occitanis (nom. inval.)]PCG94330.1 hypothetical protein PENOC_083200 [Penicillium occitanis (nom. inval.)]
MSGNYDYPPASNSTSRSSTSERPQENQQTRLQNLRNLILHHPDRSRARPRSETARALEALDEIEQLQQHSAQQRLHERARAFGARQRQQNSSEASHTGTENIRPGQHRERRRFSGVNTSPDLNTSMNQDSGSPAPPNRAGRRLIRPSETALRLMANRTNRTNTLDDGNGSGSQRVRDSASRMPAPSDDWWDRVAAEFSTPLPEDSTPASLSAMSERFDRLFAELGLSAADRSVPMTMGAIVEDFDRLAASFGVPTAGGAAPRLPTPSGLDGTPRHPDPGSPDSRWRSKRRKLDSDDNREGLGGFSYGHYGQVVPGLLKMEINSCDGGNYYDEDNGESSWPGNVLLDDTSVYCTKKSRCNMILNHRGETPFSLKKIVIRSPKKGFDAAIQEGMIFVSMSSDELLERTAQYQIHYPSRSRRCHESRRHYSNPSREYFNTYRSRTQGTEAGGAGASSGDLDAQANESTWSRRSLFDPTYAEPQFRVTTEHDGNPDSRQHDDDDFPSANDVDLLDSGEDSELFCPVDEDDSDGGDTVEFNNRGRLDSRRRDRGPRNSLYGLGSNNRLNSPSLIEPARFSAGAAHGVSGDMNGISNIMKPHARFFIEREKSMVSINFDPPVSGRYILIKLWSPYSGGNIDIESIMVHGFAGTRYFPALDTR